MNSGTNLSTRQTPSKGHSRIVDALADIGLVSAYHAFHTVAHGQEMHPTYRHQHNPAKPCHIDFCFVPVGWARQLVAVEVFDGKEWAEKSDHLPLRVDLCVSVSLWLVFSVFSLTLCV